MDETTKVIIATISGFIIAFFAEPVKSYFQNKTKLRNLKVALYKELIYDYFALINFSVETDADFLIPGYIAPYNLRTECYKQTLENELPLFYQLKEASLMNALYSEIGLILNVSNDMNSLFGKKVSKQIPAIYTKFSNIFKYMFVTSFYCRSFDVKILKSVVTPKQYQEIMDKGKEEVKNDMDVNPT